MVLFVQAPLKNSVDWYRSHWLNEQPYEAHLVDVATKVRMVRSVFFFELKSNWNRMKLSCLTYFHIFCSVSSCLAMFGFSCALRQHLEKPWGAEVGAHLNRCPAMLSDSSLRQQRGLVEKTPQVSENAMRQPCRKWCRSGKKNHHFANTEGESERLYHPFVVSYLFLKSINIRLQQILQMIDKSTNRYLILDLSTSGWMSGSHPRLFQRRPSGSWSQGIHFRKLEVSSISRHVSWKSFFRFFLLAHHHTINLLII